MLDLLDGWSCFYYQAVHLHATLPREMQDDARAQMRCQVLGTCQIMPSVMHLVQECCNSGHTDLLPIHGSAEGQGSSLRMPFQEPTALSEVYNNGNKMETTIVYYGVI